MKEAVRHIVHAESCCSPCLINTFCALWDYCISAILFLVAERASAAWFSFYWNHTTTTKHFPVKVLTASIVVLSVFLIFVTWVLWLAKGRLGRVFHCNKREKKRKMGRIVPRCLSESVLALTQKRDLPQMCLRAGRVVRVAKLRTLRWCLSYTVRPCYFCTRPVSREAVSLNDRNIWPVLVFWVINKLVPCYLEVSMLSTVASALKRNTTPTGRFSANGEQRALMCSYVVVRLPFLFSPPLSPFPDPLSEKRTLYICPAAWLRLSASIPSTKYSSSSSVKRLRGRKACCQNP